MIFQRHGRKIRRSSVFWRNDMRKGGRSLIGKTRQHQDKTRSFFQGTQLGFGLQLGLWLGLGLGLGLGFRVRAKVRVRAKG